MRISEGVSVCIAALAAALLVCGGCATTHRVRTLDASNPELRLASDGVYIGDERIDPEDIVDTLEDADIPKDHTIHIRLDRDMRDMRASRALLAVLAHGGYTRSVLVTAEHGEKLTRSGKNYEKELANAQRNDDHVFYVTEKGATYGLLTPVGPDKAAYVLSANEARKDSLIRLCGRAEDFQSQAVRSRMQELENCLKNAGYDNIHRFWLEPTCRR